ncbi:MAG: type IV toxin-antitoxin system AbiEi family antitoxin domain-containing protein [Proteobacteria bacterium]|nr:type IV toxin-antitoxin system AbiEi family antitoxin domain-containing protein [Pseudomonadota bacterium]
MARTRNIEQALTAFRQRGGTLRTGEALGAGIHPATLYQLAAHGQLVRLTRGLYRLASAEEFSNPDLAVVAAKAPSAVVCLVSALAFHELTTQVPREVQLAVPRGKYAALRLKSPPVAVYRFDKTTFDAGIESHTVDGADIRVYNVARTLVDCFKFRNKIGLDVAVEALRFARSRRQVTNREILSYAKLLRQERVMGPYLEAVP